MPDQTVEILIKTKAELAGAQAALASIEKQIGAAKAQGKATAELEAKFARAKAAIDQYVAADTKAASAAAAAAAAAQEQTLAQDGLTEATQAYIKKLQEEEEEEKKRVAGKGEIRKLVRELGHDFPILGEIGRLAMHPVVAALGLLTGLLAKTLEGITELGNRSTPEFERMTEAVTKQREAMEAVDLAANTYNRSLAALASAGNTAQAAAAAYSAKLKEQGERELALAEKNQAGQTALIDAAEKLGLLTHEQVIMRKLAMDEAYAKKREDIEKRLALAELTARHDERFNTSREADKLEQGLAAQRAAARQAAGRASFADDTASNDRKNLEETKKKQEELEKEHGELMDKTTGMGRFHTLTPQIVLEQQKSQNEVEQEAAAHTRRQLESKIKQDDEKKFAAHDSANAAAEEQKATEERLRKDRERIAELNRTLPDEDAKLRADNAQRAAIAGQDSQTRAAGAFGDLGKSIDPTALANAAKAAEAVEHGRSVNDAMKVNLDAVVTILKGSNGNQRAIVHQLAGLAKEVYAIKQTIGSRSSLTPP